MKSREDRLDTVPELLLVLELLEVELELELGFDSATLVLPLFS